MTIPHVCPFLRVQRVHAVLVEPALAQAAYIHIYTYIHVCIYRYRYPYLSISLYISTYPYIYLYQNIPDACPFLRVRGARGTRRTGPSPGGV